MTNSELVSLKTQEQWTKFCNLMERVSNIYQADTERMDRAYNIIRNNVEQMYKAKQPVNTGVNKL